MIAQELAVAAPGARRPARARLHDAGRRRRVPDARGDAAALRRRRRRSRPRWRCGASSRTRSATQRAGGARRRDLRAAALANPPDPAGWQAQAAAGTTFAGRRRRAIDGADARPARAPTTTSSTRATRELLAERIPGARVELLRGRRATSSSGSSPTRSSGSSTEFLAMSALTDRPHARATARASRRDRVAIDDAGARPGPTPSSTRAPTSSRAVARARRPRLDADRQLGRARRASSSRARRRARSCTRSRGGSRRPRSPTSSTTPSRRVFLVEDEHRDARPRQRSRSPRVRPSRELAVRTSAQARATPGDDDPLLLIYTSGTTGKPKGALLTHANCFWTNLSFDLATGVGRDDVVLQVLPQFHCGGWNVQSLLAWWKGAQRRARARLRRGARARADRARAGHDDDGRAGELPLHGAGAALRRAPTCRRCGSRSSAARRCRRRCSTSGPRAASRSSRATA